MNHASVDTVTVAGRRRGPTNLPPNLLRCGSPSCTATLTLGVVLSPLATMRRHSWRFEQQDADDRAYPYCPRCQS